MIYLGEYYIIKFLLVHYDIIGHTTRITTIVVSKTFSDTITIDSGRLVWRPRPFDGLRDNGERLTKWSAIGVKIVNIRSSTVE